MIFLVPSNWFLQLSDQYAYLTGLRVDYLIFKLYPLDLLALTGSVVGWIYLFRQEFFNFKKIKLSSKSRQAVLFFLIGAFVVSQLTSQSPWLALSWLSRIGVYSFFAWTLRQILAKNSLKITRLQLTKVIFFTLSFTIIFQSFVGIMQVVRQGSIGGYWFFGETNLSNFTNITKITISGKQLITAYGTSAHPNILAGIMAVFLSVFWKIYKLKKWQAKLSKTELKIAKIIALITTLLGLIGLLLTFSVSGWLTLLSTNLVINHKTSRLAKIYQKLAVPVLVVSALIITWGENVFATSNKTNNFPLSISRRVTLASSALNMWLAHPLSGVGLGQFTLNLEKFAPKAEVVRFLQPAHHALLLWLAETGLIGMALLAKLYKKLKLPIALLLPSLIWDHYWLSQPNTLLVFIILAELGALINSTSDSTKPN